MSEKTIPGLFLNSVKKFGGNILMWEKTGDQFEGSSYREIYNLTAKFAGGLASLGLSQGERVSLISEGRNDWVMSELAVLFNGAINVPISIKLNEPNDLKFRLAHSECKMVIVSSGQLEKIRKIKNDLPDLEKIIILDNIETEEDELTKEEVFTAGEKYLREYPEFMEKQAETIQANDYANICYTSGTTADPKGIILTHRNYTANVEQATALLPIPEYYVTLLILPWDHAFAHTAGIYTLMKNGASMASIQIGSNPMETLKNIPLNIKETRPHFLLSVPALAKNFKKSILKGVRSKGQKIENLFNKAMDTAIDYNAEGYNKGKGLKKLKKPLLALYDKILFSKIRENFGGRLEFFIGGGALLDIELQRFFYAIGIPMFQGYGLTEAAPVISANVPAEHKLGSSGKIVQGLQVKICDDKGNELPVGQKGEIVVKGENVMAGYWKNEEATKESIREGWLFTGDMGYLDKDDYLYVLGRFKSLLIASDGEKYSPEGIEEAYVEKSPFIEQIMLHNNQDPYTTALVYPSKDNLGRWIKENNINHKTEEGEDKILEKIEEEINIFRSGGKFENEFAERWLPSAVALIGEGFTEQNKFLNSTLKMVRGKITEFYKNRIDYMHIAEGKNIKNHQNRKIIQRMEF